MILIVCFLTLIEFLIIIASDNAIHCHPLTNRFKLLICFSFIHMIRIAKQLFNLIFNCHLKIIYDL